MAHSKKRVLELKYVSLSEIQRWPKNPKKHDSVALRTSINRFGFIEPMVRNDETGELLAGHGRLDDLTERKRLGQNPPEGVALGENGDWLIPVVCGVNLDAANHAAYALASNRIVELGGWDEEILSPIIKELEKSIGLEGTGFSVDDILEELKDDIQKGRVERMELQHGPRGRWEENPCPHSRTSSSVGAGPRPSQRIG